MARLRPKRRRRASVFGRCGTAKPVCIKLAQEAAVGLVERVKFERGSAGRALECGGTTPLWIRGGREQNRRLFEIVETSTVNEKRRRAAALQGAGRPFPTSRSNWSAPGNP